MIAALRHLGRSGLSYFERLGRAHIFLLYVLAGFPDLVLRFRLVIAQVWSVGVLSLVIIIVSGLFALGLPLVLL